MFAFIKNQFAELNNWIAEVSIDKLLTTTNDPPRISCQEVSVDENQTQDELAVEFVEHTNSLSNILNSTAQRVGSTITEATSKIKEALECAVSDLNDNQKNPFINVTLPWKGDPNETAIHEKCLQLSKDKRYFVKSPPANAYFPFDFDNFISVAIVMMKEDPNLMTMRYKLVPKLINEENFWRNYFYRVSLICHAYDIPFVTFEEINELSGAEDHSEDSEDISDEEIDSKLVVCEEITEVEVCEERLVCTENDTDPMCDLIQMRQELDSMSIESKTKTDWEAELQNELDDYLDHSVGGREKKVQSQ